MKWSEAIQNIDQNVVGSGLAALDAVLEQIVKCGLSKSFEVEAALDAVVRESHSLIRLANNYYETPFTRGQSRYLAEVLNLIATHTATLRAITKPSLFFNLLEGKIEKATRGSAAFDLFATEDAYIRDEPVAVPTGVRTEFSAGLEAIIKEKSGLSLKGIEVKAGVIDSDYRDEWKVVLRRPIKDRDLFEWFEACMLKQEKKWMEPFHVKAGMKIAQVILVGVPTVTLIGDGIIIKDETREGGFGSTGK